MGKPARIVELALEDRIEILTSPDIWEELIEVLRRPRLRKAILRHGVPVSPWLQDMRALARWTTGSVEVEAVPADPDDNIVIACALEGQAEFVITGDRHLRSLKHFLDRFQGS